MDQSKDANINEVSQRKESFVSTILEVKNNAYKSQLILTDKDIARTLNIADERYDLFYKEDNAPIEIFSLLRLHYGNFIKGRFFNMTKTEEIELPNPDEE